MTTHGAYQQFKHWLAQQLAALTVPISSTGAISGGAISGTSVTDSGLTATRVPFASTGGLLSDDADLTFVTDTLTAKKLKMSDLTATRVPYATTGGLLTDDAAMTFTVATGTLGATNFTAGADLSAAGGFRRDLTFTAPGAAGVVAAGQTNLDCTISPTVTAAAMSYVAKRAGSITGLSGQLSAALTDGGAAQTLIPAVTIDGTEVAATITFTSGGAQVTAQQQFAKDTVGLTFAAGAVIGVSYTSQTITNTPAMVLTVEIEC